MKDFINKGLKNHRKKFLASKLLKWNSPFKQLKNSKPKIFSRNNLNGHFRYKPKYANTMTNLNFREENHVSRFELSTTTILCPASVNKEMSKEVVRQI